MSHHQLFTAALIIQFAFAVAAFTALMFIRAPYGRHVRSGWGPSLSARNAWIVMELPAICVIGFIFCLNRAGATAVSFVFIAMWEIHYLYRTLLYPFMMRGGNKSFPFLLVAFAFAFNIINGYINGIYLFSLADPYGTDWLLDPRFIAGSLIFIEGLAINIHSDGVLRGLRRPGENNYRIPYGGLFRYVSNPNYLGEIIEWSGWALATWSLPGLAFALFTIANLAPRARANHRWYKEKFIEYPAERKILIPFIY